ncbi:hypothetical protein [Brevibacillus laterosporus]|uniref:hypothetical protein n=1 Tax=Brevibacillus laterosporus TaxID=1465 RepID=UPI0018F8B208|nr:hypothetical protein [Brevibacillus laterosporus]MBG9771663.1 hypothetical protein [Brevibacillus laterosporus]
MNNADRYSVRFYALMLRFGRDDHIHGCSAFPSGVYHIEQLFELENLQGWLPREASMEIRIEDNLYK